MVLVGYYYLWTLISLCTVRLGASIEGLCSGDSLIVPALLHLLKASGFYMFARKRSGHSLFNLSVLEADDLWCRLSLTRIAAMLSGSWDGLIHSLDYLVTLHSRFYEIHASGLGRL